MDKYTGKKLDGRYEIRELIGVGGMANVYHCYDTIDAREVAIKILKDEFLDNEDFIRRFKNESKAIAVLNHPNIVRVYDVSFGDMIQYIVMEYIDGITLKEYIDMQRVLDWKETVHLTTQILKALQHAHENGIVHRDIKPHNIMLLQDGTIKVTDFGIARFSSNATRTMTEQAIGSVHYIAPEQARGEKTDGKTDIYSVGVMMYEMLTGTLPFDGDSAVTVALMQLQAKAKLPREINPDIPEGLEQITMKAMQKNPDDRYHSAVEMLSDIERFRLNPSIRFDYEAPQRELPPEQIPQEDIVPEYEDPEEDADEVYYDEDVPVRSPVLSAIKGVIIAAIIALVVFGGLAAYQGYISSQPKEIEVPDFTNMTLSEANALNNGKFNFTYVSRYSDDIPVDTIIEQNPAGGSKKMKEGSTIELIVNSADSTVTVPYLNGTLGSEEIQQQIERVNLVPKILYVESDQTSQKIDAIYPPTGTEVKIGSTVYVFVSKGVTKAKIVMPDVKGYSAEKAVATLKEAGFTNYKVEYDDNAEGSKDEVVRQNPLQGSEIVSDYEIILVCAKGEKKEKTVNIDVDLPSGVDHSINLKVLVDGAVDSSNTTDVVPSYSSTHKISVKIKDDATIVVLLNDKEYREYKVDYENNSVSLVNSYSFEDDATEPPATEAPEEETVDTSSDDDNQTVETEE